MLQSPQPLLLLSVYNFITITNVQLQMTSYQHVEHDGPPQRGHNTPTADRVQHNLNFSGEESS